MTETNRKRLGLMRLLEIKLLVTWTFLSAHDVGCFALSSLGCVFGDNGLKGGDA